MQTAFHAEPEVPLFDVALLKWKYFEPGPDWSGSRSYVLVRDRSLTAHGCAWPVKITFRDRLYSAISLVDWAASSTSLGAGIHIMRKMAPLADILIAIGGSEATRQMMPRVGFRTVDELLLYARVLRPWRQLRTRPADATPRGLARFLRNTGYWLAGRAAANRWTVRRVETVDPQMIADSAGSGPSSVRPSGFLEYMTRCPGASITCGELLNDGRPAGYVIFSLVRGQSRIAEIRIRSREQKDWTAAVSATVDAALQFPEACELVASTSEPLLRRALEANGFRVRDRYPVFVQDPQKLISDGELWDLTMLDDDRAFLNFPHHPYAT
jgi:hypothetical protein